MQSITITVLDYYNVPSYYPFMSEDLFNALEQAFLNDQLTVSVSKTAFDKMIHEFNLHYDL